MRRSIRRFFTKKGFTLVELVVVLVMLSIIAAIGVPSYLGYVDDTHAKECELNRKRLASYLDDERVMNESATMEDVVKKYSEPEDGIRCPSCGLPYKASGMTVTCPLDGHNEVPALAWGSSDGNGGVSAPTDGYNTDEHGKNEMATDNTLPPEEEPAVTVSGLSDIGVKIGESPEVTAHIEVENGKLIGVPEWKSSEETIATVTGNGDKATIQALKEGSCTITCTATAKSENGTKTATGSQSFNVTVEAEPVTATINLTPDTPTVQEGETVELKAEVNCTQGDTEYTDYTLEWTVDEGGYAAIPQPSNDKTVIVTGRKKGTATVTCSVKQNNGNVIKSETATVTVKPKTININVTLPPTLTIAQKTSAILNASVESEGYPCDLIWKSSDSNVEITPWEGYSATVTGAGTCKNVAVTCTVVPKDHTIEVTGNFEAQTQVTVSGSAKEKTIIVEINPSLIECEIDKEELVTATVTVDGNANSSDYILKWNSSDFNAVSVNGVEGTNTAYVTAHEARPVTITCTANLINAEPSENSIQSDDASVVVREGKRLKMDTQWINGDGIDTFWFLINWPTEKTAARNGKDYEVSGKIRSYLREALERRMGQGDWVTPLPSGITLKKATLGSWITGKEEHNFFQIDENPAAPNDAAKIYNLEYTAKNEDIYEIPLCVVYPCKTFDKNSPNQNTVSMKVGQTANLQIKCTPRHTTDRASWTTSAEKFVSIAPNSTRSADKSYLYDTITIKAEKAGSAVITASTETKASSSLWGSKKKFAQQWTIIVTD